MAWILFPTKLSALQAEEVDSHPLDNDFKVRLTLKQKSGIKRVDFTVPGKDPSHTISHTVLTLC